MTVTIKDWIYEKVQTDAQKYMRTLCWDSFYDWDDNGKEVRRYTLSAVDIVKETEKAICFNCRYWSTRSHNVNFTVYSGHNVWIPKSALIEVGGI